MIIQTTRLDFLLYTAGLFMAGWAFSIGLRLAGWLVRWNLPDSATAPAEPTDIGETGASGGGGNAGILPDVPDVASYPAAALPHLGGPRPFGWETPEEEIARLEDQLEALYAADRDRIRDEADRLAAELLGDVRAVEEYLQSAALARPDWLPERVSA